MIVWVWPCCAVPRRPVVTLTEPFVLCEASWKLSRSPLATRPAPPSRSSAATAEARKSSASKPRTFAFANPHAATNPGAPSAARSGRRQTRGRSDRPEIARAALWAPLRCPIRRYRAGSLRIVEPQQKICEADDRARAIAIVTTNCLRQRVVGSVREKSPSITSSGRFVIIRFGAPPERDLVVIGSASAAGPMVCANSGETSLAAVVSGAFRFRAPSFVEGRSFTHTGA